MVINKQESVKYYSPLRYPGGKNKLSAFVAQICLDNKITTHYIEPYAGGASVALFLLLNKFVQKITINDKDRAIYALWYSVLHYTDELCDLITNATINMETWKKQKAIQKNKHKENLLSLGFSTLFLNRTNRSGIISAGAIGGTEQLGNYKMDCRFNKADIIARIKIIAAQKKRIKLYNKDAIELIDLIKSKQANAGSIIYFDPPYFDKGSSLYLNHYKKDDHVDVSEMVKSIEGIYWIVSYDNVTDIKDLYTGYRKIEYSFKHTAYKSREGKEILFFSDNLTLPVIDDIEPTSFKFNTKKNKIEYRKSRQHSASKEI